MFLFVIYFVYVFIGLSLCYADFYICFHICHYVSIHLLLDSILSAHCHVVGKLDCGFTVMSSVLFHSS